MHSILFSILTIIVFFVFSPSSFAQMLQQFPASSGKTASVTPEVIVDSLPNGLRYFLTKVNDIPVTEISIIVEAGLSCEAKDENGLAYATAELLPHGSKKYSTGLVNNTLYKHATIMIPYVHNDYAQLYIRTLKQHFSTTLDLAADAVINPVFNSREVELLKRQIDSRIPEESRRYGSEATKELLTLLDGEDSPLRKSLQPSVVDIEACTEEQIRNFHSRYYRPERTTVIVSGDLEPSYVRTIIKECFGQWNTGEVFTPRISSTEISTTHNLLVNDTGTVHNLAYFRFGLRTIPPSHSSFPALVVLNSVLGEGDSSRLRTILWGKHIVSPSFVSSIIAGKKASYVVISGSTSPQLADSVVILVKNELRSLAESGISESELQNVKEALLRDSAFRFSGNRHMQSMLKEAVVYGTPINEILSFPERIRDLTVTEVNNTARIVFDESQLRVVILGDASVLNKRLKTLLSPISEKKIDE